MLPADFDPFFAVTGVRKRDWSKPVPSNARTDIDTTTRAREAKWNRSKRVGGASA